MLYIKPAFKYVKSTSSIYDLSKLMRSCFDKSLTNEPNQVIDRSALANYISCY